MSDIIQLLPDHVANQIAAGEVIQRPASVVKELLENAVDAQATSISLVIKDAGKTLIQVTDDGIGLSTTDARLAFERHATSKIKVADDLFQLRTKGFRGEALASIAAISHVELKTRQEGQETGTHISIKGSEITAQEPCVTPKGTAISVKNLFYNVPARRNFLKSKAVESRHIIDEFERVALAHPQIAFSMHHNGGELFRLPKSGERQRIVGVLGEKTNERLVPVDEETNLVKISGFIGKPEYARRTKGKQFFFVNRRFIKSGYLHHAVSSAFEGLLSVKKHPAYFLFFEVDPQSIDINIHPTKTEIKFDDEHAIYAILRSAVKHSLGQFNVVPALDFQRNSDLDTPYSYTGKTPKLPKIEVDPDFNPFKDEGKIAVKHGASYEPKQNRGDWEGLYAGMGAVETQGFSSFKIESDAVSGTLFPEEGNAHQAGIFQIQNKYIVSALKEGLLIIDQHRAHSRILYEDYLRKLTAGGALSQQLLFPLSLDLSSKELEMLDEVRESLEQTGFDFSTDDSGKTEVCGIPSLIAESEAKDILDRVLADLADNLPGDADKNATYLASALAENTAVKTGDRINQAQQSSLINQLFACKEPALTPANEPIFIRLNAADLDKKFK